MTTDCELIVEKRERAHLLWRILYGGLAALPGQQLTQAWGELQQQPIRVLRAIASSLGVH